MSIVRGCLGNVNGFISYLWHTLLSRRYGKKQSTDEQLQDDIGAIIDDNYYKRDILIVGKRMVMSTSVEERINAVRDIGHIAWLGGPAVARLAANHLIEFARMLQDDEAPDAMKIQILYTISEICMCSIDNQNTARSYGLLDAIYSLLESEIPLIRCGAVACLVVLINENYENHISVLRMENIEEKLIDLLQEDWSSWKRNEAKRLILMLGLNQSEDNVDDVDEFDRT